MPDKQPKLPLSQSAVFNLPTPPVEGATSMVKAYEGWVYAGISTIAKEVSTINLRLMEKQEGKKLEIEEIHEHESLSLLSYVNDFTTQNQLWEIVQTYLELTGEAYLLKVTNKGGGINQLWALRPDWVTVKPSTKKFIDHYKYRAWGMGKAVKIDADKIIPFKFVNPTNPYRGKGSVQAAARAINILHYAEEWNESFFYNAAIPSIIMTSKGDLNEETVKRWKEKWKSEFRGASKSHKIAFLGGGDWKIHEVGENIKEMDFINLQNNMRDQILGILGVPRVMTGSVEKVNRATVFGAKQIFAENVVRPRMINIASTLTEFLLPDYEEDSQLFFDYDDPVPEDIEQKKDLYESALASGWMTINEVRNKEGLPEVEGGDTIYLPFNLQPIGGVVGKVKDAIFGLFGKKQEEEAGMLTLPVTDKKEERIRVNMPIPPKRLRQIRKEKLKADIKPDLVKLISNILTYKDKAKVTGWTDKRKEAFWKQAVVRMETYEDKWRRELANLFEEQENEVMNNLDSVKYYAKDRRKGKESSFLFNLQQANRQWKSIFGPLARAILVERGREVLDFLGIPQEIDLTHDLAVQYLEEESVKFVKSANHTTREKLRKTLAEGLKAEEGINSLKRRVEEVFENAYTARAEAIARTETSRAVNFATNLGYNQSGVVEAKEWLTALDERTCPFCNSLNGKVVDVDGKYFEQGDTFVVEGESLNIDLYDIEHPPVHPNCRCTLVPVTISE